MFTQIANLLSDNESLALTVRRSSAGLVVTVVPAGDGKLRVPLVLSGTAAELDAEFAGALEVFHAKRHTLTEQLAACTALLEAEAKANAPKGKAGKQAPASASSAEDDPDDEAGNDGEDGDSLPNSTPVSSTAAPAPKPAAKPVAPADPLADLF